MDLHEKTKDELIKGLQELQQEYNSLKALYRKDTIKHHQAEQELSIANKELAFQNDEKEKRAAELIIANEELARQNELKEKRAEELVIANKELAYQSELKEKRAAELVIANKELAFQNDEKEKRAAELVIAKEHAEQSDRLKSAFLANMSHEIRTPMNGVLGFASILKEADLSGEERQEYLELMEQSGTRMLNIINDIVDISKIESGLMKVHMKESNINEQIDYIHTFFKPEMDRKRIQFICKKSLSEKGAVIHTDREKIYAILTNLVKNALKYTDEGSIEFGYNLKPESQTKVLEFYIKDTGIGIPKQRQEAIFERFIQADITDKKARQGAGLGLSISKAFVELLGGKIWVTSEEGKGSTFYFTLPYNTEPDGKNVVRKVVLTEGVENPINPEVSGLKILIAEDDETSGELISVTFNKLSKEVIIARTGNAAVEICRKNPELDLILMDIRMPDLNGYEATRRIRKFNNDVVIIAQTAFGLFGDREKAIEAGCNDYIAKPINKADLLSLVQKHLYNKSRITEQ
jgi:signal transduction histidine kinase/ActR/RegA family two-component response regulator